MNARAKLKLDDKQTFTISLTAPLSDWRALKKQLETLKDGAWYAWPVSTVMAAIEQVMDDLDKTYERYDDHHTNS